MNVFVSICRISGTPQKISPNITIKIANIRIKFKIVTILDHRPIAKISETSTATRVIKKATASKPNHVSKKVL